MKCDRHCRNMHKTHKTGFSAKNPHIILLSEAIHCKMFAIHKQVLLMRVHHKVSRVPSRVASLDPSGLLDIASFICICSRVFSVVKVRQSEGEQGNPLLPRGIWTKTPVWLKLSLFCLAARAVLLCSTAGIYTPQSSLTAHLPVEIDSLCFLQDERDFEPLVHLSDCRYIRGYRRNLLHHRAKSVQIFSVTLPTRVFKLSSWERSVSITLSCPPSPLVSLSQSVTATLFIQGFFMTNICHIASLS